MDALTALYRDLAGPLTGYAAALTGNRHTAEDIVSETFLRAMEHCMVRDSIPARAWFYKVARNLILDQLRKRRFQQHPVEELELTDDTALSNPEAALARNEAARELSARLSLLPESYRTVLLLREYNGLTYSEIADVTGSGVGNVKVLLFRARQKLKELYRKDELYEL